MLGVEAMAHTVPGVMGLGFRILGQEVHVLPGPSKAASLCAWHGFGVNTVDGGNLAPLRAPELL